MAMWELVAPFRQHRLTRATRWPSNIALVVLDTLLVRILLPIGAVGLAIYAQSSGLGLFNTWSVPAVVAVPLGVVLLDLAIYAQHVLFHAVPALWRLHRVHHADTDLDVTTGVRFHPIEIILSMLIKLAVVATLGIPPLAVLAFEVLLNATSMFNHTNARLPGAIEPAVRWLLVTPDMHRVHHSVVPAETNSNYGFNLSIWDRLFRTYRPAPVAGHEGMDIGLTDVRDPTEQRLDHLLTQPFRNPR
jgi:sterol desaturase/sphingolipid hydroxylase (fatty acid hydroxylase superfamily)